MDHEALLALYDRRRACSRVLNDELVGASGRESMMTAGRRLGLVQNGTFVFDNEQETAVLADACVYAVRDASGECVAQRVARSGRYPEGSIEQQTLDAMSRARFSLFTLTEPVPGVGVTAIDVFTGQSSLVVDRGLSTTSAPMFATRLVDYPEFSVTTGAGIPIPTRDVFVDLARALDAKGFTASVLRAPDRPVKLGDDLFYVVAAHLLRAGVLRHTRYIDPTNSDEVASLYDDDPLDEDACTSPQLPVTRDGPKVGRNDPCPCGSGKKHKKCHGG